MPMDLDIAVSVHLFYHMYLNCRIERALLCLLYYPLGKEVMFWVAFGCFSVCLLAMLLKKKS